MKNILKRINRFISVAIVCVAVGEAQASSPVPPTDSQQRAAHDAAAFLSGFARATKATLVDSGAKLHILKATNQQPQQQQPQADNGNNDTGRW